MGAREKLNVINVRGGLIAAAIVGVLARSWVAFAATAGVLVGLGLHHGEIRPRGRAR